LYHPSCSNRKFHEYNEEVETSRDKPIDDRASINRSKGSTKIISNMCPHKLSLSIWNLKRMQTELMIRHGLQNDAAEIFGKSNKRTYCVQNKKTSVTCDDPYHFMTIVFARSTVGSLETRYRRSYSSLMVAK
jgi:hypothetical protein